MRWRRPLHAGMKPTVAKRHWPPNSMSWGRTARALLPSSTLPQHNRAGWRPATARSPADSTTSWRASARCSRRRSADAMSHVTVTINGRQYRMACEDGQENHLIGLARDFDQRIIELHERFGEIGDARLT